MAKSTSEIPVDRLELYEKLAATLPGVTVKGATVPYTSMNGHMFSYLSKEGRLELRLPDQVREGFIKTYKTSLTKAYGVVQKEYVEVPDALLKKTGELKEYFAQSLAYVRSLKPKPTTRKKPH
jgi:hypothetical protein